MSKQEVKEFIVDNSHVPRYKYSRGGVSAPIKASVDRGKVDRTQLPQISDPEYIKILMIGGGGRVNANIGKSIGGPVTMQIEFPDDWDELVEEYRIETEWVDQDEFY